MDTFAKPIRMNPEMSKLVDKLRSDDEPCPVCNRPAAEDDVSAWHAV